ncbi:MULTISPECIES: MMPL family transporter [Frankia]|uniref:MMPL family transporter n=1 Tax=Frankia TaxID=1854 RepID=UPI00190FC388|nr:MULTISPECIES: MMPL family transporter [Frankia]
MVRHPVVVIVLWLVAIGACAPFALKLSEVQSRQGSSKIVPGSVGDAVAQRLVQAFPHHSERETLIVLSAPDVTAASSRRLMGMLDASLQPLVHDGSVMSTTSPYTLHRDALLAAMRHVLAPAGTPPPSTEEAMGRLAQARATGQVPAALVPLLQRAARTDQAEWPKLAGTLAEETDWADFPVPVDAASLISDDHRASLVTVAYSRHGPDPDLTALRRTVAADIARLGPASPVHAAVTGELALIKDTYDKAEADNAKMEYAAYIIIIIVLLLFFRAVVPAVLTLTMIGLAMTISQAWLYAVGSQVELTQFTTTIMTFVMLGAGVDYSMLLSSRYRQERLAGRDPKEAVVNATIHAGESIALAGSTVILAFAATLLSPVDWIPPLGYGGLAGIPVMLLAALTITPALLVLLGDKFFLLGVRPLTDMESKGWLTNLLRRLAVLPRRAPVAVVAVFVLATIPIIVLLGSHRLTSDPVALSPDTDARRGYNLIAEHWQPGLLQPTTVVGDIGDNGHRGDTLTLAGWQRLDSLSDAIARTPGVVSVSSLSRPTGTKLSWEDTSALPQNVRQDFLAPDGALRLSIVLAGDPLSEQARSTIRTLTTLVADSTIDNAQVGGATVIDQEYDAALTSSFWKMIAFVCAGVIVLLTFALRSILVPIRLILTIALSNIWALGATLAVFAGWLDEPVINDLPIFLVILMMGLGMDYEIFLITRIREITRQGSSDADAVTTAIVDTGRVITAAGLVMAGTLGTMMLSSTLMLREYGFGLSVAVLLDATLIRLVLAPATLLIAGKYNWWLPSLRRRAAAPDGPA